MKKTKQYLVIGLGRFGSSIATTLASNGMEVLGMDVNMSAVETYRAALTHIICGDAMDINVLKQVSVKSFDVVVVSIAGDIKASCIVTMHLKDLGAKQIVVKAHDDFHGRMLKKLGADMVIFPERDMGQNIARLLVSDGIMDYIALSNDYSLVEIRPRDEWIGKTLKQLDLRSKYHMNVVAVRRNGDVNAVPNPDTMINEDDVMLVIEYMPEGNGTVFANKH